MSVDVRELVVENRWLPVSILDAGSVVSLHDPEDEEACSGSVYLNVRMVREVSGGFGQSGDWSDGDGSMVHVCVRAIK